MKTRINKKDISPEFDFFIHSSLDRYKGKYIAILGRKIVSSGSSAKDVWEEARKKYPKSIPTIAKVPKQELLVLLWR